MPKLAGEDVHQWHQKHLEGAGIPEIACTLEVSNPQRVIEWFKKHELEVLPPEKTKEIVAKKIDWSPLDQVNADKRGRGYSAFSPEDGQAIKEFILGHPYVTLKAIATRLGVSVSAIVRIRNGETKYSRPVVKNLTSKDMKVLFCRYKQGEPVKVLAREKKISPQILRYRFRKMEKEI